MTLSNIDTNLLYTSCDVESNWFYNRYFYQGGNSRYYTFQIALNLLQQWHNEPIIIETGCQREEEDVGAGMSTSIFATYVQHYGGCLISVDIDPVHLGRTQQYIQKWPEAKVNLVQQDSVQFLKEYQGTCSLLYLDSLDYPIGQDAGNIAMQKAAQEHCLNEFRAIENRLEQRSIVLLDDNQIDGGGKPIQTKEYMMESGMWMCLLDLQQSLWVSKNWRQ